MSKTEYANSTAPIFDEPTMLEELEIGNKAISDTACATFIICAGIRLLRESPELSQTLHNVYFDGTTNSKNNLADGILEFQKGGFRWTFRVIKHLEDNDPRIQFSLYKEPPGDQGLDIEQIEATLHRSIQSGKLHTGSSSYSNTSPRININTGSNNNLELMRNTRKFFKSFRTCK